MAVRRAIDQATMPMIILGVMFVIVLYVDISAIQSIDETTTPVDRTITLYLSTLTTHVMLIVMFLVLMNATLRRR